jgi:multidrug efflux pump subunit AcrA (membrane-fusion protein)
MIKPKDSKKMSITFLIAAISLTGCNEKVEPELLYTINKQTFSIDVPAKGEFFAAKATVISAPLSRRGMQNIAWLAPEFSHVKKGDIVARFDGDAMFKESHDKQFDLQLNVQEIIEKKGHLEMQLEEINKDISLISQETQFAQNFTIDDVRIRAKIEILDELQNTEFLLAKEQYLNWQIDSFSKSSEGEMSLLTMQKAQNQNKIKILQDSLSQLEVKAPHDGLLTYQANWRGEKPLVGQSIWPGSKIGELPDTNEMKAKLHVYENEAIGLTPDKEVTFYLNANADVLYKGKIESVAKFPQSIKRGDPQKYFEVIITLNQQHPLLFVPGGKLEATIHVSRENDKIIIPLQSVFKDEKQSFVYLYNSGEYTKTVVTLGDVSLSHAEVTSGLSNSQKIALFNINMRDKA